MHVSRSALSLFAVRRRPTSPLVTFGHRHRRFFAYSCNQERQMQEQQQLQRRQRQQRQQQQVVSTTESSASLLDMDNNPRTRTRTPAPAPTPLVIRSSLTAELRDVVSQLSEGDLPAQEMSEKIDTGKDASEDSIFPTGSRRRRRRLQQQQRQQKQKQHPSLGYGIRETTRDAQDVQEQFMKNDNGEESQEVSATAKSFLDKMLLARRQRQAAEEAERRRQHQQQQQQQRAASSFLSEGLLETPGNPSQSQVMTEPALAESTTDDSRVVATTPSSAAATVMVEELFRHFGSVTTATASAAAKATTTKTAQSLANKAEGPSDSATTEKDASPQGEEVGEGNCVLPTIHYFNALLQLTLQIQESTDDHSGDENPLSSSSSNSNSSSSNSRRATYERLDAAEELYGALLNGAREMVLARRERLEEATLRQRGRVSVLEREAAAASVKAVKAATKRSGETPPFSKGKGKEGDDDVGSNNNNNKNNSNVREAEEDVARLQCELREAEALERVLSPTPATYAMLLAIATARRSFKRVLHYFSDMQASHMPVDDRTLFHVLYAFSVLGERSADVRIAGSSFFSSSSSSASRSSAQRQRWWEAPLAIFSAYRHAVTSIQNVELMISILEKAAGSGGDGVSGGGSAADAVARRVLEVYTSCPDIVFPSDSVAAHVFHCSRPASGVGISGPGVGSAVLGDHRSRERLQYYHYYYHYQSYQRVWEAASAAARQCGDWGCCLSLYQQVRSQYVRLVLRDNNSKNGDNNNNVEAKRLVDTLLENALLALRSARRYAELLALFRKEHLSPQGLRYTTDQRQQQHQSPFTSRFFLEQQQQRQQHPSAASPQAGAVSYQWPLSSLSYVAQAALAQDELALLEDLCESMTAGGRNSTSSTHGAEVILPVAPFNEDVFDCALKLIQLRLVRCGAAQERLRRSGGTTAEKESIHKGLPDHDNDNNDDGADDVFRTRTSALLDSSNRIRRQYVRLAVADYRDKQHCHRPHGENSNNDGNCCTSLALVPLVRLLASVEAGCETEGVTGDGITITGGKTTPESRRDSVAEAVAYYTRELRQPNALAFTLLVETCTRVAAETNNTTGGNGTTSAPAQRYYDAVLGVLRAAVSAEEEKAAKALETSVASATRELEWRRRTAAAAALALVLPAASVQRLLDGMIARRCLFSALSLLGSARRLWLLPTDVVGRAAADLRVHSLFHNMASAAATDADIDTSAAAAAAAAAQEEGRGVPIKAAPPLSPASRRTTRVGDAVLQRYTHLVTVLHGTPSGGQDTFASAARRLFSRLLSYSVDAMRELERGSAGQPATFHVLLVLQEMKALLLLPPPPTTPPLASSSSPTSASYSSSSSSSYSSLSSKSHDEGPGVGDAERNAVLVTVLDALLQQIYLSDCNRWTLWQPCLAFLLEHVDIDYGAAGTDRGARRTSSPPASKWKAPVAAVRRKISASPETLAVLRSFVRSCDKAEAPFVEGLAREWLRRRHPHLLGDAGTLRRLLFPAHVSGSVAAESPPAVAAAGAAESAASAKHTRVVAAAAAIELYLVSVVWLCRLRQKEALRRTHLSPRNALHAHRTRHLLEVLLLSHGSKEEKRSPSRQQDKEEEEASTSAELFRRLSEAAVEAELAVLQCLSSGSHADLLRSPGSAATTEPLSGDEGGDWEFVCASLERLLAFVSSASSSPPPGDHSPAACTPLLDAMAAVLVKLHYSFVFLLKGAALDAVAGAAPSSSEGHQTRLPSVLPGRVSAEARVLLGLMKRTSRALLARLTEAASVADQAGSSQVFAAAEEERVTLRRALGKLSSAEWSLQYTLFVWETQHAGKASAPQNDQRRRRKEEEHLVYLQTTVERLRELLPLLLVSRGAHNNNNNNSGSSSIHSDSTSFLVSSWAFMASYWATVAAAEEGRGKENSKNSSSNVSGPLRSGRRRRRQDALAERLTNDIFAMDDLRAGRDRQRDGKLQGSTTPRYHQGGNDDLHSFADLVTQFTFHSTQAVVVVAETATATEGKTELDSPTAKRDVVEVFRNPLAALRRSSLVVEQLRVLQSISVSLCYFRHYLDFTWGEQLQKEEAEKGNQKTIAPPTLPNSGSTSSGGTGVALFPSAHLASVLSFPQSSPALYKALLSAYGRLHPQQETRTTMKQQQQQGNGSGELGCSTRAGSASFFAEVLRRACAQRVWEAKQALLRQREPLVGVYSFSSSTGDDADEDVVSGVLLPFLLKEWPNRNTPAEQQRVGKRSKDEQEEEVKEETTLAARMVIFAAVRLATARQAKNATEADNLLQDVIFPTMSLHPTVAERLVQLTPQETDDHSRVIRSALTHLMVGIIGNSEIAGAGRASSCPPPPVLLRRQAAVWLLCTYGTLAPPRRQWRWWRWGPACGAECCLMSGWLLSDTPPSAALEMIRYERRQAALLARVSRVVVVGGGGGAAATAFLEQCMTRKSAKTVVDVLFSSQGDAAATRPHVNDSSLLRYLLEKSGGQAQERSPVMLSNQRRQRDLRGTGVAAADGDEGNAEGVWSPDELERRTLRTLSSSWENTGDDRSDGKKNSKDLEAQLRTLRRVVVDLCSDRLCGGASAQERGRSPHDRLLGECRRLFRQATSSLLERLSSADSGGSGSGGALSSPELLGSYTQLALLIHETKDTERVLDIVALQMSGRSWASYSGSGVGGITTADLGNANGDDSHEEEENVTSTNMVNRVAFFAALLAVLSAHDAAAAEQVGANAAGTRAHVRSVLSRLFVGSNNKTAAVPNADAGGRAAVDGLMRTLFPERGSSISDMARQRGALESMVLQRTVFYSVAASLQCGVPALLLLGAAASVPPSTPTLSSDGPAPAAVTSAVQRTQKAVLSLFLVGEIDGGSAESQLAQQRLLEGLLKTTTAGSKPKRELTCLASVPLPHPPTLFTTPSAAEEARLRATIAELQQASAADFAAFLSRPISKSASGPDAATTARTTTAAAVAAAVGAGSSTNANSGGGGDGGRVTALWESLLESVQRLQTHAGAAAPGELHHCQRAQRALLALYAVAPPPSPPSPPPEPSSDQRRRVSFLLRHIPQTPHFIRPFFSDFLFADLGNTTHHASFSNSESGSGAAVVPSRHPPSSRAVHHVAITPDASPTWHFYTFSVLRESLLRLRSRQFSTAVQHHQIILLLQRVRQALGGDAAASLSAPASLPFVEGLLQWQYTGLGATDVRHWGAVYAVPASGPARTGKESPRGGDADLPPLTLTGPVALCALCLQWTLNGVETTTTQERGSTPSPTSPGKVMPSYVPQRLLAEMMRLSAAHVCDAGVSKNVHVSRSVSDDNTRMVYLLYLYFWLRAAVPSAPDGPLASHSGGGGGGSSNKGSSSRKRRHNDCYHQLEGVHPFLSLLRCARATQSDALALLAMRDFFVLCVSGRRKRRKRASEEEKNSNCRSGGGSANGIKAGAAYKGHSHTQQQVNKKRGEEDEEEEEEEAMRRWAALLARVDYSERFLPFYTPSAAAARNTGRRQRTGRSKSGPASSDAAITARKDVALQYYGRRWTPSLERGKRQVWKAFAILCHPHTATNKQGVVTDTCSGSGDSSSSSSVTTAATTTTTKSDGVVAADEIRRQASVVSAEDAKVVAALYKEFGLITDVEELLLMAAWESP